MKAVWKKLIAVAFCGATAASMLSVGASAYFPYDNTIEYGQNAKIDIDDRYDVDHCDWSDIVVTMKAGNYDGAPINVYVNVPSGIKTSVEYVWSGDNINIPSDKTSSSTVVNVDNGKGGRFTATCKVTINCSYTDRRGVTHSWQETTTVSIKNKPAYPNKDAADVWGDNDFYYDSNYENHYKWDTDKIYWDGDYYWYWSNGSWHHTSYYPGLPDWDRPSRPSYSKEYEVDWDTDTFYYNGKVQMPTATVTIGGRTIELDVKLISGDGKSVGRHRVRASIPSRYSRYDITGTNFYYEIEEPEKDGFVTENGNTYYYDNGRRVTGWQTINGSRYYFLDNGEAADGWVKDGPADWYYFSDGKMQTGWINDNGTTYYCYGTGKMCHGRWHEIAGKWYYFNESGAMLTSQWILDKGNWYYVAGDGVMATNTTVPGGYRVNASGVWVK